MISLLSLFTIIILFNFSSSFETNMNGYHLNITVVHEPPYVDVGLNDGTLLPKSYWSGYMIDMIRQLSTRAGFTYELFLPSGNGPSCTTNNPKNLERNVLNARNYVCGQEDSLSLNISDAYWSLYYVTTARQEAGTLFTLPFLSNQGLGILTKIAPTSFYDEITLIFSPFSNTMWLMTIAVTAFVALIVYIQEVITIPKRRAVELVTQFRSGISRKDASSYEDQIDEIQHNSNDIGLFDTKNSLSKLSSYFLGTFSGLMSASDVADEEQTKPTGQFATTWVFFVLFWASAYTANLAATLTISNTQVEISDLEQMNRHQMTACAKSGAAYTKALGLAFPQLDIREYPSTTDMVFAMERRECHGIVDTIAVLNGIANGVIDLDKTNSKNFCDINDQLLIAGEPRQYGLTDMAVGINPNRAYSKKFKEVADHWITVFKTCAPKIKTSPCWEGGNGGHALERLRILHVEKSNCGETHLTQNGQVQQLGISNFFVPICGVVVAGLFTIWFCYWNTIGRIWKFRSTPPLDAALQMLITENPYIVKKTKFKTVDILMLEEIFKILEYNEDHLLSFVRSSLNYFLYTNMTLFFILLNTGAVYFPNAGLEINVDDKTDQSRRLTVLNCAAASRAEALKLLKFLVAKAVKSYVHDTNSLDSFIIVCKDRIHHDMILKGLQNLDDLKSLHQLQA